MKRRGIALCAPSGTGKTTIARRLVDRRKDLVFSVSATTRAARPGERPGVDYHFVDRERFESMIVGEELLEWAEVHGEFYGTPSSNLLAAEEAGAFLLLDIDVQGARQVSEAGADIDTVFLLPPSAEALLARLQGRGSESRAEVELRLRTAQSELAAMDDFDYVLVNEDLEKTVALVERIIDGEAVEGSLRVTELRDRLVADLAAALS